MGLMHLSPEEFRLIILVTAAFLAGVFVGELK